jgi:hypothetical protein
MTMFDFINRIRNFDIRKLTPMQWAMIAVGAIVGLWVLSTLISIATSLLPVAILGAIGYVAYRTLSSRDDDAKEIQKIKREEQLQQATTATAKAAQQVDTVIATKVAPIEKEASRLSVDPIINPETGVSEPNMSRLLEQEEKKLKDAKQASQEDVQQQLEERRKRLLGGQ